MIDKLLYRPSVTNMIFLVKVVVIFLFVIQLDAADAEDGSQLHQNNCIACHAAMTGGDGTVLYTRKNRMVTSIDSLHKQVHRCQSSLGLNWSATQKANVAQFLNESYYKF